MAYFSTSFPAHSFSALSISSQTHEFGEHTQSDRGAAQVMATGATSYSITAGNGSGHFQIDSGAGTITPTSTGDTAELNEGPYTLTIQVGDGATTTSADVTIPIIADAYSCGVYDDLDNITRFTPGAPSLGGKTAYMRPGVYLWNTDMNGGLNNKLFPSQFTIRSHGYRTATFQTVPGTTAELRRPQNLRFYQMDIYCPYDVDLDDGERIVLKDEIRHLVVEDCEMRSNFLPNVLVHGFPNTGNAWRIAGIFGKDGTAHLAGELWFINNTMHDSTQFIITPGAEEAAFGDGPKLRVIGNEIYNGAVDGMVITGAQPDAIIAFNDTDRPLTVLPPEFEVASVDTALDRMTTVEPHGYLVSSTQGLHLAESTTTPPNPLVKLIPYQCPIIDTTTIEWPVDITDAGSNVFVQAGGDHADLGVQGLPGGQASLAATFDFVNQQVTVTGAGWDTTRRITIVESDTTTVPTGLEAGVVYIVTKNVGDLYDFPIAFTDNGTSVSVSEDRSQNLIVTGNRIASVRPDDGLFVQPDSQILFFEDINNASNGANNYSGVWAGNIGLSQTAHGCSVYNPLDAFICNNVMVSRDDEDASTDLPRVRFLSHLGDATAFRPHMFENYASNTDFGDWNSILTAFGNVVVDPANLIAGTGDEYSVHFDGPTFGVFDVRNLDDLTSTYARKAASPGDTGTLKTGLTGYVDFTNKTSDLPRVNRTNAFSITPQTDVAVSTVIEFGPFEITDVDMLYAANAVDPEAEPSVNGAAVWVERSTEGSPEVKITGTASPTADIITDWTDVSVEGTAILLDQGEFAWVRDISSASNSTETSGDLYIGQERHTYSMTTVA